MAFKKDRAEEQLEGRLNEILNACAAIYGEKGFDAVTVKAIAERTSFSRPSIYNYYETKDEILLGLLTREYSEWTADLQRCFDGAAEMDKTSFCRLLTRAFMDHEAILKLATTNLYVLENGSREARICDFKVEMGKALDVLKSGTEKYFPDTPREETELFPYTMIAYVYGLYPITQSTPKQDRAMEKAGFAKAASFEVLCNQGLQRLMSAFAEKPRIVKNKYRPGTMAEA